ncbi:MAG: SET domain-containing protein-lysine N-methyltransferase [Gammaproteobacteria bacterium]|nr:SET domain-containing protein-lysine N-methyltransferase [Gammaproteobacteria bacterium]
MKITRYSSPIYAKLTIGPSSITGRGLFAGCAIPARAKIGEFEGEIITIREARRRAKGRRVVAIVELESRAIDATATRRGFRFINHSCAPNTFTRLTDRRAEFYALRKIQPGEELTVDYGESHHNGKLPCQCGANRCSGWI